MIVDLAILFAAVWLFKAMIKTSKPNENREIIS